MWVCTWKPRLELLYHDNYPGPAIVALLFQWKGIRNKSHLAYVTSHWLKDNLQCYRDK